MIFFPSGLHRLPTPASLHRHLQLLPLDGLHRLHHPGRAPETNLRTSAPGFCCRPLRVQPGQLCDVIRRIRAHGGCCRLQSSRFRGAG